MKLPYAIVPSQKWLIHAVSGVTLSFKVAKNLANPHRLYRTTSPPHIALEEAPPEFVHGARSSFEANAPESEAVLAERLEELEDRLSELSPKLQAAILWHHRDGYVCEEIGEKLTLVRTTE